MASRRGYLTQAELSQYADITILDVTEADDQISQAEELLDGFVGPQEKFMSEEIRSLMASVSSTTVFTLNSIHQNTMQADYLKGCWVEIIGGTGAGQTAKITSQTLAGVITVETAFTTLPDTTSFYKIWQLGQFPRIQDTHYDSIYTSKYYKYIPEAVKRAIAAQLQFVVEMGDKYFSTDASGKTSERIGDYSYQKGGSKGITGGDTLIAPKAKILLKGIVNRTGSIVND